MRALSVALQGFAGARLNPLAIAVQGLIDYLEAGGTTVPTVEVSINIDDIRKKKRFYVKRKKQILVFESAQEADDYLIAEAEAEKVIATKTSRRARKRAKERVITVKPEVVEVPVVQDLIERFDLPFDLPDLVAQQDWQRVYEIYAQAMRMMDDEDVELLLMA